MLEVKAMEGSQWHGYDGAPKTPEGVRSKVWSVKDSDRNDFRIRWFQWEAFTQEEKDKNPTLNPYWVYDKSLITDLQFERPLYEHQKDMVAHFLTRHYACAASEMGTGKSLAGIEAFERAVKDFRVNNSDYDKMDRDLVWYVGPRAGVRAVNLELEKWNATVEPRMITYEELIKVLARIGERGQPPMFVFFDESFKIKTPKSQRSIAALSLANWVRQEWGWQGYVIEVTGTPAPKNPGDWWHQCEVLCPGYLREGNVHKFRDRLSITETQDGKYGSYKKIITWLDDDKKCEICGVLRKDHKENHDFEGSVNEVANLYARMKGLVIVQFKKDCLDLPEKQYELIKLRPTIDLLRAARLIIKTTSRAIDALRLVRELSDGFQYTKEKVGMEICAECNGSGEVKIPVPQNEIDIMQPYDPGEWTYESAICDFCGGKREVPKYARGVDEIESQKDQVFLDELDSHDDVGRYTVWGGFTATIDRLTRMAHQQGWATLRVDGRGLFGENHDDEILDADDLLKGMDNGHSKRDMYKERYPKICYVGQPEAGGLAYTLTASPTGLFFSNSFSGVGRMQAEDRGHRPGMDLNLGYTIKDIELLPVDRLLLDNLQKKKNLQRITMGDLDAVMRDAEEALR